MSTNIPADMQDFIDKTIGHQDYAPYVLDGQSSDNPDDYHDVAVIAEDYLGIEVIKFTRHPGGEITHYRVKGYKA